MTTLHKSYSNLNSPDELYGDLFIEVQMSKIFSDYKTFPDCIPIYEAEIIMKNYHKEKEKQDFNLRKFISDNFELPDLSYTEYKSDTSIDITKHIDKLWHILTKKTKKTTRSSSLISLPYSYVIPGGRFREVFYWDSYFIMEGLIASGKTDLFKDMINNFTFLIDSLGFIPNGNRTYFLSRSQPPMYAMMVALLAEKDENILVEYIPSLEKEHMFWMTGSQMLENNSAHKRVVKMENGTLLNRYWDDKDTPRPEAYGKEIALTKDLDIKTIPYIYKNIRAACESGWDFSTRWFMDESSMKTIHITDMIPVDLNCLLYFLEMTIGKAYQLKGNASLSEKYYKYASDRKDGIIKYCWSEKDKFFMDYDFILKRNTNCFSIAASYPLYFNIASQEQANLVAKKLQDAFLKDGGFLTTLVSSDYQWDAPNGWAPMQWMTAKGLMNYNHSELAREGAHRWTFLNEKIYKKTGKLLEKYNVVEMNIHTGGGEYPLQDGFGWTNGVYIKLKNIL
jgi:alpha,alpha-trehalase